MQYASRAIPKATKEAVVARDGLVCHWCARAVVPTSRTYRPDQLHFDHVTPWAAGGGHDLENLVVSCAACNLSRERPKVNVREARAWVEYRYGKYWWPTDFEPPRLVPHDRCSILLGVYVADSRCSVAEVVRDIHAGRLAATGQGEPICVEPPHQPRLSRRHRMARLAS